MPNSSDPAALTAVVLTEEENRREAQAASAFPASPFCHAASILAVNDLLQTRQREVREGGLAALDADPPTSQFVCYGRGRT